MTDTTQLSNDAILGLDLDLNFNSTNNENDDLILDQQQQNNNNNQLNSNKPKRRTDKLTPEILLSKKGIPKIVNEFKILKFQKRKSNNNNNYSFGINRKNLINSNSTKFGEQHHYDNLTSILHMYQNWGHSLGSHLKFDRFIENLARGVDDTITKHWIRDQIREEMRIKMERQTDIEANKINKDKESTESQIYDDIPNDILQQKNNNINDEEDGEEEWAELFGGRNKDNEIKENNNTFDNNNQTEDDIDLTQIKQTPIFSTYLRASSQPVLSQDSINNVTNDDETNQGLSNNLDDTELDAFDALDAMEAGGLQDLLNDDDQDTQDNSQSQQVIFSQYIAQDSNTKKLQKHPEQLPSLSSPPPPPPPETITQNTTIEFSNDEFSDDDDDYFS
jgi:hypothetical protein